MFYISMCLPISSSEFCQLSVSLSCILRIGLLFPAGSHPALGCYCTHSWNITRGFFPYTIQCFGWCIVWQYMHFLAVCPAGLVLLLFLFWMCFGLHFGFLFITISNTFFSSKLSTLAFWEYCTSTFFTKDNTCSFVNLLVSFIIVSSFLFLLLLSSC